MSTLLVAAGGGGDAIAASALRRPLRLDQRPTVLTYSWDRLILDPLPGPRSAVDFAGLEELSPGVLEVLPTSAAVSPAGSSLPRLAAEIPARLLLLDPSCGAQGMSNQIRAAAEHFGADTVCLVDVGGDVLAQGGEPGLRSPLADLLALAACTISGHPCQLLVLAPGIDSELPETTVMDRLHGLDAHQLATLDRDDVDALQDIFTWHPSEASGMLAAAARGVRGIVEVRDAGDHVSLSDNSPTVYAADAYKAAAASAAAALQSTATLDEAKQITKELTGVSEIEYETAKASRLETVPRLVPTRGDLPVIDRCAAEAAGRGADYTTIRRLAERLGTTTSDGLDGLRALLATERPEHYQPPLYQVTVRSS